MNTYSPFTILGRESINVKNVLFHHLIDENITVILRTFTILGRESINVKNALFHHLKKQNITTMLMEHTKGSEITNVINAAMLA